MMRTWLKRYLNIHPSRVLYWLGVALLVRSIVWFFLYYNLPVVQRSDGVWGIFYDAGDSADYQKFAENLIAQGRYALYLDKPISYAGRMPGWAAPYLFFRIVLSPTAALNAMQVLQMTLSVLSVYALAWLCWLPSRKQHVFCIVLLVYAALTYVAVFDITHLTESLTLSSLILGVALGVRGLNCRGLRSTALLLLSGALLAWCVFLRPVMLIAAVVLFASFYFFNGTAIRQRITTLATLTLPLCQALGAWVVRNFFVLHQFIPLTSTSWGGEVLPPHTEAIFRFVQHWGGDNTRWYPNAAIRYFDTIGVNLGDSTTVQIPTYAYCAAYTTDSLLAVRALCQRLAQPSISKEEYDRLSFSIAEKLNRYSQAFQIAKPQEVYLLAPMRTASRLVFQTGAYYLSSRSWAQENWAGKLFKLIGALLYAGLLLAFVVALLRAMLRPHPTRKWVMACAVFILLYLIAACGVFHHSEYRLILPCLPVLIVGAALGLLVKQEAGQPPSVNL